MDHKSIFPLEWSHLTKWVIATSLGFLIFDGASFLVPSQSILSFLYLLFFNGIIIAVLQWLFVLRLRIPNSVRWVWWGIIGWTTGWLLGKFSANIIISLLIHGTILGITQWAFIVRKLFPKSLMWVLANAFGLPFAYGLSWFVIFPIVLGNYSGLFSGPLDSAIRGALFGAITGTTLLWLSRLPHYEMEFEMSSE